MLTSQAEDTARTDIRGKGGETPVVRALDGAAARGAPFARFGFEPARGSREGRRHPSLLGRLARRGGGRPPRVVVGRRGEGVERQAALAEGEGLAVKPEARRRAGEEGVGLQPGGSTHDRRRARLTSSTTRASDAADTAAARPEFRDGSLARRPRASLIHKNTACRGAAGTQRCENGLVEPSSAATSVERSTVDVGRADASRTTLARRKGILAPSRPRAIRILVFAWPGFKSVPSSSHQTSSHQAG